MKPNNKMRLFILAALALMTATITTAQNIRKNSTFDIKVSGTSNLHDWTMEAKSGSIDANLNLASNVTYLAGIQSLNFSMPVKNLKSESSLMDSRAYDALKADKYTTLTFKLLSATPAGVQNNKTQFRVTGQLTIAGVTRQITMIATAQRNGDGVIITGSQKIKMTEYNVRPPSFMFGAMKCGDDLTIDYTIRL